MDEFDKRLEEFEVPAKRLGDFDLDLNIKALKCGFTEIERGKIIREGQPDLCLIASRPGHGKTQLMLQCALNIAKSGKHVLFFSLEMGESPILSRAVVADLDVNHERLIHIPSKVAEAKKRIKESPLYIDAESGLNINVICGRIRDFHKRHSLSAVFLDYIQYINGNGSSVREIVGTSAKSLKNLAKELNVPIICAAQAGRSYEQRKFMSKFTKPGMSDLAECSQLEMNADQVIFIDRVWKAHPNEFIPGETIITVAKNRHYDSRDFKLMIDQTSGIFKNWEEQGL